MDVRARLPKFYYSTGRRPKDKEFEAEHRLKDNEGEELNLVASQKATSPAVRTEARQGHGEKRGSPKPRRMSQSNI